MLIDSRQLREDRATQVCVVGAGPAGLAIAMHLLRSGIETTVLAGGGEDPDSAHQQLARVVSHGIPTDDTMRGNIRALGGTSHVWGGYCLRMTPEDF
jgi:NADPH-dependent 2,4-dienoyl-CoA reductase/sulfur reductase-like enzyme